MRHSRISTIPAAGLAAFVFLADFAKADLTWSNLNLTPSSLTVDVIGVMPATNPVGNRWILTFINPDVYENPGFAITNFSDATSISFTGTQGVTLARTGSAEYGDYAFTFLSADLAPGEALNGTFSFTWGGTVFDPSQVVNLNVYWGAIPSGGQPIDSGVLVGSNVPVNVPEPSTAVLGSSLIGLGMLRRRRY